MTIRKATMNDLATVMSIYDKGKKIMRSSGNLEQWKNNYPGQDIIEADIQAESTYVCINDNKIVTVFYFSVEEDPTYSKIDGSWINDKPYGVIHRIARIDDNQAKGSGTFCIKWCLSQHPNVRIDTHKDNTIMINLLKKLGFTYCGVINLANGSERLAFQKDGG